MRHHEYQIFCDKEPNEDEAYKFGALTISSRAPFHGLIKFHMEILNTEAHLGSNCFESTVYCPRSRRCTPITYLCIL